MQHVVSCRATRAVLESAEAAGFDPARLVEGTGLSVAFLRDGRNRTSWEVFAKIGDNLARLCGDERCLFRIGVGFARVPGYARVYRAGALFVSPRQIYAFFCRWFGPSQLPFFRVTMRDLDDGRISVALELPEPLRPSRATWLIMRGGFAAMPRVIGLSDAHVELRLDERGRRAEYVITPPRSRALLGRARRVIGSFRRADEALEELEGYRQELQESYDALLRSRQDFRDLLEKMSDSVCVHRDGRVVWGNREFVRQLGYERIEEVIGLDILEDLLHPDDAAELAASIGRVDFPADAPPRRFRVLRRDGSQISIEISAPQIVDFDGAPARLIVGRDVTERVRLENAMIVADRMASLGMIAAGVAHEINNPLAYVHANLQVATRALAREDGDGARPPDATRQALAAAVEGTDRVRAIVRDLRTLSRGEGELIEPLDPREIVEASLSFVRKDLERRARLALDFRTRARIRGDRARLGQVLLNLLLNAIDAVPDGAPAGNEIAISVVEDGRGGVVLAVRDTGRGIAPEHLARVFEPFFTTKAIGQGTGLGLAICHRIVTGLGGSIDVESRLGVGSTFRVTLPRADDSERRPAAPVVAEPAGDARGRVLVVDDEPKLLAALAGLLEEHHEVVSAASGRAALDIVLEGGRVDAILCDLMMADVTGMELYEVLAAKRPGLERRVVFMTGGAFTPRAQEFLGRVKNRCLEKPFSSSEMIAAIDEQVALARGGERRAHPSRP